MAQRIVFTDSGFWKYSWAHLVMSMTESCRWVMQCRLRAPKTTSIQQRSSASSLTHRDFSSFSESFDDVMLCRWWDLQSLCNLTLRNVVFKVFQCVCVCVCVCHARSDTSALEIRSRGGSGFNSLPVRSPDFEKRWAIPLSACWSRFVY